MKKKTEMVIREREKERRRAQWYKKMNSYLVHLDRGRSECVLAEGYTLGESTSHLVFFLKIGDELVEVARFREWISVMTNLDSLYSKQEKNP